MATGSNHQASINRNEIARVPEYDMTPVLPSVSVRAARAPLVPQSYAECQMIAENVGRGSLYGLSAPQAFIVLVTGMDMGLSPGQALRGINVIHGRPSPSAALMVAVCLGRTDLCEYFRVVASDDKGATWACKRVGNPEREYTFTEADAKQAGWYEKNAMYKSVPRQMYNARASAFLAREEFPDLMFGLQSPEEMRDTPISETDAMPAASPAAIAALTSAGQSAPGNGSVVLGQMEAQRAADFAADAVSRKPQAGDSQAVLLRQLKAIATEIWPEDTESHYRRWIGYLPKNIPVSQKVEMLQKELEGEKVRRSAVDENVAAINGGNPSPASDEASSVSSDTTEDDPFEDGSLDFAEPSDRELVGGAA